MISKLISQVSSMAGRGVVRKGGGEAGDKVAFKAARMADDALSIGKALRRAPVGAAESRFLPGAQLAGRDLRKMALGQVGRGKGGPGGGAPGAILRDATLTKSKLPVNMKGVDMELARAQRVVAPGTSFAGANVGGTDFTGAVLRNTQWKDARLSLGTRFTGADMRGADLSGMNVDGMVDQLWRRARNGDIKGHLSVQRVFAGAQLEDARLPKLVRALLDTPSDAFLGSDKLTAMIKAAQL